MKRTYTFFVATKELLRCPEIYQHAKAQHIVLEPGEQQTLNIVTPLEHPLGACTDAHVSYDTSILDISLVHLIVETDLLYITIKLRAIDIGQTDILLTIPDTHSGFTNQPSLQTVLTS